MMPSFSGTVKDEGRRRNVYTSLLIGRSCSDIARLLLPLLTDNTPPLARRRLSDTGMAWPR